MTVMRIDTLLYIT